MGDSKLKFIGSCPPEFKNEKRFWYFMYRSNKQTNVVVADDLTKLQNRYMGVRQESKLRKNLNMSPGVLHMVQGTQTQRFPAHWNKTMREKILNGWRM
jgi:hypothetical protein